MPPNIDRIRSIAEKARAGREVTLGYGSETAVGLKGGIDKESAFEIQGYVEKYAFSVWIDSDAFTAEPVASKSITVNGATHRILGVKPDSIGAEIRMDLGGQYGS